MRASKRWWLALLTIVVLPAVSCTNDGLDDGGGPDVVMEIRSLANPAVTAELLTQGQGGPTTCTLEVEDWTVTIQNLPKNVFGDPLPFNDIVLETVEISYVWQNGIVLAPRVVGLGDVAIPANGTNTVTFAPLSFTDLDLSMQGQTADLTLVFSGRTIEGTTIRTTVLRQLFVEVCPAP